MAFAVLLLFAVIAQVSASGSAPGAARQPVTAAPVTLTLRLTDQRRQFRPGEVIPLELEFNSATTGRYSVDGATYDRSGRLTIDDFVIDRIDDVSDPMLDYFGSSSGDFGGIRGIGVLGEKPFMVKLELNELFRFDTPGNYTLAVTSQRVTDESVRPPAVIPVESNTVSFEILPRSADWEAAELDKARRMVDTKQPFLDDRAGCRIMRFLGTEEAAMEMVRRYGADPERGCDFDYMAGLFGAANRPAVVRALEAGLRAADQPVTYSYLRTLSTLSVYVQHPEFRPAQTRETKGRLVPGGELAGRRDLIDAALSAYGDIVTAALPDKTGRARAITLAERRMPRQPSAGRRRGISSPRVSRSVRRAPELCSNTRRAPSKGRRCSGRRAARRRAPARALVPISRSGGWRSSRRPARDPDSPRIHPRHGATLKTSGSLRTRTTRAG
jgi:hypothetical protein